MSGDFPMRPSAGTTIKSFPKGGRPSHRLAALFPMLLAAEHDMLAEDIKEHGLREPIAVLAGTGEIVDGRNRYAACLDAGLDPDDHLCVYPGDPEDEAGIAAWAVSKNLHRRHLKSAQRALIAAEIAKLPRGRPAKEGPENGGDKMRKFAHLKSQGAAADLLNVSRRVVQSAAKVVDDGSDALKTAVREAKVSVHMAEAIAKLPKAQQDAALAMGEKGLKELARDIRANAQAARRAERLARNETKAANAVPLSDVARTGRRYTVIYADPPWKHDVINETTGYEKAPENHYPTMDLAAIKALPVPEIAADDCALFLWATAPHLDAAIDVMRAWGFTYKSRMVWDKETPGTGYWFIDDAEILLLGTKGDVPAPLRGTQARALHRERKGPHSAKPDHFRRTIERYFPGPGKIELFRRGPAAVGWDAWGNETIHQKPDISSPASRRSAREEPPSGGTRPEGREETGGDGPGEDLVRGAPSFLVRSQPPEREPEATP